MAEVRQYKSDIWPKGMFTKYMYTMISDMVHPFKDIIAYIFKRVYLPLTRAKKSRCLHVGT